MSMYKIAASLSGPPLDVWLTLDSHEIKMVRDSNGAWSGTANLTLPTPVPIRFRATGITSSAWTLTIRFTPSGGGAAKTYTHSDSIPNNLLSDLTDQMALA